MAEALEDRERMENYRAGLAAAAVYNAAPGRKRGRAVQPLDFFGRRKRRAMSDQEILLTLEAIATCKSR